MFSFSKIVFWVVTSWILFSAQKIVKILYEVPPVPSLPQDTWWGPGEPKNVNESIRPFHIKIRDEVIIDLQKRLDRYLDMKKTPPLENSAFHYGFNSDYLTEIAKYWRSNYNWTERQEYLNRYPQFKTYINGLEIHFLHITPERSSGKEVLPLMLLHGWPGSVREFYEIIPLLTASRKNEDFVFELVIPSLPGYGFSQGASKPGFGAAQMAVLLKNLMERLGFEKFYVQGGDWGAQLARYLGVLFPQKILGVHGNMCFVLNFQTPLKWIIGSYLPFLSNENGHYDKLYPLLPKILFILQELGYMHIQASKPDTIGAALEDTPIGLAAYILEKFSTWTDPDWRSFPDGGLTKKYSLDSLLDNVMIYWVTGSITTSQRLYAETFNVSQINLRLEEIPLEVPTACARFPKEVFWLSRPLLSGIFTNLIQVSDFEEGGHFPAFEIPQILNEDIRKAVKTFRELPKTREWREMNFNWKKLSGNAEKLSLTAAILKSTSSSRKVGPVKINHFQFIKKILKIK